MGKTILYKLFGFGKIPKKYDSIIEKEGILFSEEGISGFAVLKNFKTPGKRYGYRSSWFTGSIVLTKEHLLAFQYHKPTLGISWKDVKSKNLNYFLKDQKTFCVRYEAADYKPDWSGSIELRYKTEAAAEIVKIIQVEKNKITN